MLVVVISKCRFTNGDIMTMAVFSVVCSGCEARHSHTNKARSRSHPPSAASRAGAQASDKMRHRSDVISDGRSYEMVGHRPRIVSMQPTEACCHQCQSDNGCHVTGGCLSLNNNNTSHLCHDKAQRHGIVTEIKCHHCNISHIKRWHVTSSAIQCSHHCTAPATYMVEWSGHVTYDINLYVYDDFVRQPLTLYRVYAASRSESDDDEIDDKALNNILIVTQTPPYMKKHPQGDRHPNPDYIPRAKMTQEIAKMINDGLCYYEEELWHDGQEVRQLIKNR